MPPGTPSAIKWYQEGRFIVDPTQFTALGTGYLTKQADALARFCSIDMTGLPHGEAPSDGSRFEQGSYCEWVTGADALSSPRVGLLALIARAGL